MKLTKSSWLVLSLFAGLFASMPARAGTISSNRTKINNVNNNVPSVRYVPGKEYSDTVDIDQNSIPTPEQTLLWDGNGNVSNGFNYGGDSQVNAVDQIALNLLKSIYTCLTRLYV